MTGSKNEKLVVGKGVVTEALPSTLFRVKMEDLPAGKAGKEEGEKPARTASQSDAGGEILAYLGGKMRMHRIKVLIGDKVEVVLDSYGGKGRIIKRL